LQIFEDRQIKDREQARAQAGLRRMQSHKR
jgi:hypothetical protein